MSSHRVFDLRWVRDEEAEEVRQLLYDHDIEFYETPYGYGRGNPALWVNDDENYARARQLMDAYQTQRMQQSRAEFAPTLRRLRMHGHLPTRVYDALSGILREQKATVLFLTVLAVFIALTIILT